MKSFIHPTINVGKIVFKSTHSMDEALSTTFGKDKKIPVQIRIFKKSMYVVDCIN